MCGGAILSGYIPEGAASSRIDEFDEEYEEFEADFMKFNDDDGEQEKEEMVEVKDFGVSSKSLISSQSKCYFFKGESFFLGLFLLSVS